MPKIKIIGFTDKGTFIAEDGHENYQQLTFEGFKLNRNLEKRKYLREIIGTQIEGSINKNLKTFRYSNEQFFKQLINKQVVTVSQSEIDSSKIYSSEQKLQFKKISSKISNEQKSKELDVINLVQNHQFLQKKIRKRQKIVAVVEYYTDNIVVSFQDEDKKTVYLPIRLKHMKNYFNSVKYVNLGNIIKKFATIQIEVSKVYYSLQDKQNIVEVIAEPQYEQQILKNGLGTISLSSSIILPKQLYTSYNLCQKQAQQKFLGIFEKTFQMLNLIYTKNNLVGTVEDIFDDFTFQIRVRSNQQMIRLHLINIYTPVGQQPGAYECKQFARKNLIGKQVNVFLKEKDGLHTSGSMTRISDSKDIEQLFLENGWALLNQDLKSSLTASKAAKLQLKAKSSHKGLHKSSLNTTRLADLTQPNLNNQMIHLEKRRDFLNSCSTVEQGSIESIISPTIYHVRIDSKRTLVKVRLQSIMTPNINESLPQYLAIKNKGTKFLKQNFTKRTVQVSLVEYKKSTNEFIGTIKLTEKDEKTFQQLLLQQSLVFCKKDEFVPQSYIQIQNEMKKLQKGVWQPKIAEFRPRNFLDEEPQFKGKFSWVIDGEKVFVQPAKHYDMLENIWKILNEKQLIKMPKQQVKVGALCVTEYCGEFYRAQILNVKSKKIKVLYIDWGNRETVQTDKIFKLDENLQYVPAQCFKVRLNIVKRLKNKDCIEQIREQLLTGQQYNFKKFIDDQVDVYCGVEHINISLIEKGYIKFDRNKIDSQELHQYLFDTEKTLRLQKAGIWQYSEQQEQSEDLQEEMYLEEMIDK